jgi:hypothetical protein
MRGGKSYAEANPELDPRLGLIELLSVFDARAEEFSGRPSGHNYPFLYACDLLPDFGWRSERAKITGVGRDADQISPPAFESS